jgi:hypothetical protein
MLEGATMDWTGQGALGDTVSWGLILGVFLPWVTALVQRPSFSEDVRKVVAILAAVVAGVLTCLANGSLDEGQTLLSTVAIILVSSSTAYRNLWKAQPETPAGARRDSLAIATKIEYATSPGHARHNRAA